MGRACSHGPVLLVVVAAVVIVDGGIVAAAIVVVVVVVVHCSLERNGSVVVLVYAMVVAVCSNVLLLSHLMFSLFDVYEIETLRAFERYVLGCG